MKMDPLRWWRGREARDVDVPGGDDGQRTLLSAYLDGEVSAQERTEVEAALHADPALAADLAELQAVRDALAGLGEVRAPRSFAIFAPPVAAPRGLSRLEVLTRAGASVASLAFVLLLVVGEPDLTGGARSTVRQERASDAAGASTGGQAASATPALRDSGVFAAPEAAPAGAPAPANPAAEPRRAQDDARGGALAVTGPAPQLGPTAMPAIAPAPPVIAPASTPALAAAPSTPPSGAAGAPAVASATPKAEPTPNVGAAAMAPVAPTATATATAGAAATATAAPLDVTPALAVPAAPPATATPAPDARARSNAPPARSTSTVTIAPSSATATAVAYAPIASATPHVEVAPSASEEAAAPATPARMLTLVVGVVSAALLIAAVAQWAIRTR